MADLEWETRKWWVNELMAESNVDWFKNVLGIIDYFGNDADFADLDGWASLADAAVLVVIQDGWRMANGQSAVETSGDALAASTKWQTFFVGVGNPDLASKDEGKVYRDWGLAEQAGVNYGTALAAPLAEGVSDALDVKIDTFVGYGNLYRSIISCSVCGVMRHFPPLNPRTETSRTFVRGFSQFVINPTADVLWGQYQTGGRAW